MLSDGNDVAFELSNGTFNAVIAGLANISAASVLVQYTSTTANIAAGTILSIGSLTYTFADAIAANTVAFAVMGFSAEVTDFVTLSGNLGFKRNGSSIIAVGSDVTASLVADIADVSLANADFGLIVEGSQVVFELKNGVFAAVIAGLTNISAASVLVQYTSTTANIAAGTVLSIGSVSYTFVNAIAADTVAFAVIGFSAEVATL
jgi:hypothetical protein